ncbi:FkbM family methyltransferase [Limnohabitans sp. Rim8]|uniref:FkbM family methyltransferase n=1 Tax=Limnohabitans sp. Rim8 TaxID=1100718 RepID=UPI0026261B44|nr:FkbM family methyltransferase [Limnohabitans sp. Rim8]
MQSDFLRKLLQPGRLTHVVDVGANPIDGDPPYKAMLEAGLCTVTGFEPQASALAELEQKKSSAETYLPYALGAGDERVLNICRYSGWTSLLYPRPEAFRVFSQFQDNATVIDTLSVQTRKLDDIAELQPFDMLKIDVQGAERDVFLGGIRQLQNAVAIQTEVSFIPMYIQQPVFGDIDVTLRKLGFVPHCFSQVKTWPVGPLQYQPAAGRGYHQLLEADVVYVKDFIDPIKMSDEQLKHLCLLMHHCYGSIDLSGRCLEVLEQRGAIDNGVSRYVTHLNSSNNKSL